MQAGSITGIFLAPTRLNPNVLSNMNTKLGTRVWRKVVSSRVLLVYEDTSSNSSTLRSQYLRMQTKDIKTLCRKKNTINKK